MARYTGPRVKKARRYGAPIFANAAVAKTRRNYPPGPRSFRRRKISDRGQQLIEKQKVRFAYGLMEKQFRRYYESAVRRPGVTGDLLMQMLEERLDNTVFRLGFGRTRSQARQLVTHGHIAVNGKKLDIASAWVKPGTEISFTARGARSEYVKILKEEIGAADIPSWLELNRETLVGKVVTEPPMGEYEPFFNPNAIIEYYSR